MRRRIVWTTAALAVLLVVPSMPASAAEARFVQPEGDVTGATPIEVRVDLAPHEPVHRVHLRLIQDGVVVGEPVQLECGCEDTDRQRTYTLPDGDDFDPRTGSPFGDELSLVNGPYRLRLTLDRGRFFEAQTFHHDVHLSVAPAAPGDFRADVDGSEVALTWQRAPEPDLDGYRVERLDGDEWKRLTTTSSATYVDDPGEGTHTYRVVALRPDGRNGTLEAASTERKVEVLSPEDARRNGNGDADGDDADRDGDDEGDGDGNGNGDDANGSDAEAQQGDASQQRDSSRRSRSSGAEAPSTGSGRSGSIPGIGERDADGYTTELDYGALGDGESADDVRVANPGGWQGALDRMFDAERVAVPVAAGLVMTGMGLHLWRWLRVPLP